MGIVVASDSETPRLPFSVEVTTKEVEDSVSDDANMIMVDPSFVAPVSDVETKVCEDSPVPTPDSPSEVTTEEPPDWVEKPVSRVIVT